MLTMFMPKPEPETLITLCGPTGLVYDACIPILERIGHGDTSIHVF